LEGVVGGIGIGDQQPLEPLAQQGGDRLAVAAGVDAKDGKRLVAGIPKPAGAAIFAPVGFIGVNHCAKPHLGNQVGVDRRGVKAGALFEAQGAATKLRPKSVFIAALILR
jgi:hypothetical protein